jgi:hypothetical protein
MSWRSRLKWNLATVKFILNNGQLLSLSHHLGRLNTGIFLPGWNPDIVRINMTWLSDALIMSLVCVLACFTGRTRLRSIYVAPGERLRRIEMAVRHVVTNVSEKKAEGGSCLRAS